MGNFRSKLILTFIVSIALGSVQGIAVAQVSGIDHYRSRLGHTSESASDQVPQVTGPKFRSARLQLPVHTEPKPIFTESDRSVSKKTRSSGSTNRNRQPSRSGRTEFGSDADISHLIPSMPASTRGNSSAKSVRSFSQPFDGVLEKVQAPLRQASQRSARLRLPAWPVSRSQEDKDVGGVVVPPDAIQGRSEPDFLDDGDFVPGVIPDQTIPRPGEVPEEPSPRRSLPKTKEPERRRRKKQVPREFEPSIYDLADPRHPNASNGPDSWFRSERNSTDQFSPSAPQNMPLQQGTVSQGGGFIAAPPAPAYSQPNTYQPGYDYSSAGSYNAMGVYGSSCCGSGPTECNGTPGYANGGCNSCGTGIVNGCFESVFYLSLFGGYSNLSAINTTDNTDQFRFDFDDGYGVGAALGQYQGKNLRTEIEFSFREHDFESLSMPGDPFFVAPDLRNTGMRSYAGMANALWEFVKFPSSRVKPYVGAGFGFVGVESDSIVSAVDTFVTADDSDSSFAYQAICGLNFRTNLMMDVFVEYRYLKADSLQLGGFGFDYETSNIFGGARIQF